VWQLALALVAGAAEGDEVTYNLAISAAADGSCPWQLGLDLIWEMRRHALEPDRISYNTGISMLGSKGRWTGCLELLRNMAQASTDADVISLNAATSAAQETEQWAHAIDLLTTARRRSLQADAITFNTVISATQRSTSWQRSVGLFEVLRASGAEPSLISYNAVLGTSAPQRWGSADQGSMRRWVAALEVAEDLARRGGERQADAVTLGSLAAALQVASQWEATLQLLRDANRGAGSCFAKSRLDPNAAAFASLVGAAEGAERWEQALDILTWCETTVWGAHARHEFVGLGSSACTAALGAVGRGRRWELALGLFRQALASTHQQRSSGDPRMQQELAVV
ncbi:unnamed protein product, partial [Polarella glacialis]